MSNDRLNWIDYSKGIGIILVVYGHVLRGLHNAIPMSESFFTNSDNFIYSFHMPLFFILSGFFFFQSFLKRGMFSFMKNKLETIAYPFIVWSILQTIVEVFMSSYTNGKHGPEALFTCLIYPRAQFWFLFALFFINVINVICFNISKKFGLFISLLIGLLYLIFKPDFGTFSKTFLNLVFFNAGILFFQHFQFLKKFIERNSYFVTTLLLFTGSEFLLFAYPSLFVNNLLPQLSGSLLIIQISFRATKKNILPWIETLGRNSMPIYLASIIGGSGIRVVLTKIFHINNVPIHIILGTIVGIIFSLYLYSISKKTPFLSWLFEFPLKSNSNKNTNSNKKQMSLQ